MVMTESCESSVTSSIGLSSISCAINAVANNAIFEQSMIKSLIVQERNPDKQTFA